MSFPVFPLRFVVPWLKGLLDKQRILIKDTVKGFVNHNKQNLSSRALFLSNSAFCILWKSLTRRATTTTCIVFYTSVKEIHVELRVFSFKQL